MIFTHCGKLGDCLQTLPIISRWCMDHERSASIALANFAGSDQAAELIALQPFVDKVYKTNYVPGENWGGYPYNMALPLDEEQIHLGFRYWPDKSFLRYVAEEHGLSFNKDFKLNYGKPLHMADVVVWDRFIDKPIERSGLFNKAFYIDEHVDLIKATQILAGAKQAVVFTSAPAIVALLARIRPTIVGWQYEESYFREYVYKDMGAYSFIELGATTHIDERFRIL